MTLSCPRSRSPYVRVLSRRSLRAFASSARSPRFPLRAPLRERHAITGGLPRLRRFCHDAAHCAAVSRRPRRQLPAPAGAARRARPNAQAARSRARAAARGRGRRDPRHRRASRRTSACTGITDGEFRRTYFHIDFLEQLDGVETKGGIAVQLPHAPHGNVDFAPPVMQVTGKVRHVKPIQRRRLRVPASR